MNELIECIIRLVDYVRIINGSIITCLFTMIPNGGWPRRSKLTTIFTKTYVLWKELKDVWIDLKFIFTFILG